MGEEEEEESAGAAAAVVEGVGGSREQFVTAAWRVDERPGRGGSGDSER